MPYNWTAERERLMLLVTMCHINSKPSNDAWEAVARVLGGGLSTSAISQKYYKMRKDAVGICNTNAALTPPATPTKRKTLSTDSKITKRSSTAKRTKKSVLKEENLDGGSWSSFESFQEQLGTPVFADYQNPFAGEHAPQLQTETMTTRIAEGWVENPWSLPNQS